MKNFNKYWNLLLTCSDAVTLLVFTWKLNLLRYILATPPPQHDRRHCQPIMLCCPLHQDCHINYL